MKVLGIESTAHTFGIGVIDGRGKILLDERNIYKPEEGIVPTEAAEFHKEKLNEILQKVVEKINLKEIDFIGVSTGPGLPPCLEFGFKFGKELAKKLKKPLIGINHCQAHIEIGKFLTKVKDPIVLYVSGGNTQIIYYNKGYRILGETQDIGIGNAIDKLGRAAGVKFPAGPEIEKISKNGKFVLLPYSVKGMDLNFSGVLSEGVRRLKKETLVRKDGATFLEKTNEIENIFYSFQEVCFAMLAEVTERALAATEKSELLLVGGVAQNKRLQQMLETMCKDRNVKFKVVPKKFAGDNGTMIALTALLNYKKGEKEKPTKINPNWRIDGI